MTKIQLKGANYQWTGKKVIRRTWEEIIWLKFKTTVKIYIWVFNHLYQYTVKLGRGVGKLNQHKAFVLEFCFEILYNFLAMSLFEENQNNSKIKSDNNNKLTPLHPSSTPTPLHPSSTPPPPKKKNVWLR